MKTALFTLALLAQLATAQAAIVPTPSQDEASTSASAPASSEVVAALKTSGPRDRR
jgi:hypothetical protein